MNWLDASDTVLKLERAADDWIAARLLHFDPFVWASREERYIRRKAFAELSLYCMVRQHFGKDDDQQRYISSFVIERVNEPGFADLVMRGPRQFLLYSAAALYAHLRNELAPASGRAVDAVLAGDTVWGCERPPHRMLDLWHFLVGYGDARASRMDRDLIVATSCLRFPPDPVDCILSEAYALTHNLLFLHNFGCGGPGYLNCPSGYRISDVMQTQIVRWLAEPNFDIVFELVMTGVLEDAVSPDLVAYTIKRQTEAVTRDGFVRGPRPPKSDPLPVPAIEPAEAGSFSDWSLHYHTNLVVASTMRVLHARWNSTATSSSLLDLPDDEVMGVLSRIFSDLAAYELLTAAAGITEISDSGRNSTVNRCLEIAREYIARQRRESGLYGYYLDEAKLHAGTPRSDEAARQKFEAELQRPVSSQIDSLIGNSPPQ